MMNFFIMCPDLISNSDTLSYNLMFKLEVNDSFFKVETWVLWVLGFCKRTQEPCLSQREASWFLAVQLEFSNITTSFCVIRGVSHKHGVWNEVCSELHSFVLNSDYFECLGAQSMFGLRRMHSKRCKSWVCNHERSAHPTNAMLVR